ncbi:PREDICTED: NAC [Prunus dulcis]|uniref:PREDICTED: NAC n=1 Tax=Prunus dulcis TaxID=3755 RepID=A0A5E4GN59_PRUDU|nr:NAC transcription factor 29-like [Prunus dulcis]XP_034207449.1 NAC transcription factor 29-like [Prunus dulcis]VVA41249.1 PREDICTED: NAC [Prunus dulcis]
MAPNNIPMGFKFRPSDEELLGYYLLNKVRGSSFKYENVIPEFDLYGRIEPWDIWNQFGGNKLEDGDDLYFFTKLKSSSAKNTRMARTIGSGSWKAENSGKMVPDPKDKKNDLGMWKRLHYENPKSDQNGCWIMHEYSLRPSLVKPKPNSTHRFVVCRIRKNHIRKRKFTSTAAKETHGIPSLQSQNKKQRQQETSFDEYLIGDPTPMSQAIGGGPTETQSPQDCPFAYPITMVDDGDVLMGGFSPLVDSAQSFTEQAEFGSYNQERTECIIEFDETHATQQGLTDNNIGAAATEETGCQFGSENSQSDNVDFSIDYGWLHHLIQVDDDDVTTATPSGSQSIHQSAVNDEDRPAYDPSSQSLTAESALEFGMSSENQTGAQLGVGTESAQVNASEFQVHNEDMLDFLNTATFDQLVDLFQFPDDDDDEVQAFTTESSVMGIMG